MKICVLGHSEIHIRQQKFFQYVASQGHEVMVIAPGQWGDLLTKNQDVPLEKGSFNVRTCRHIGGENQYQYRFIGAREMIERFNPDWVYIQQEHESAQAQQVADWRQGAGWKLALFTWENIVAPTEPGKAVLAACDLVVCGNGEALELVKPYVNREPVVMLQVGVDTDHFQRRPGVPRDMDVSHVGRIAKEKGCEKLVLIWPSAVFMQWQPWQQLPWWYSKVKVVVNYSLDTPFWKEQAPPFTAVEALSCGCGVVVSNGGSIPYWLRGGYTDPCPGVIMADQKDTSTLYDAIKYALPIWEKLGQDGRDWVMKNLSVPVMAKKLIEALAK